MSKLNYYEYKKTAKQGYKDAANKFEWFADYNLWHGNHTKWKIVNRDKLFGRGYTISDLYKEPHYPDLAKYAGDHGEEHLLNFIYEYDELKKDYARLYGDDAFESGKIDNSYIKHEKDRIRRQKESRDYKREDHFAIGTVYLNIPPAQISISNEMHNFRYNTLRSTGETIASSGRSTTRVDLDIYFSDLDSINNKLRPLLAQIKTTPFLPIENEYIKTILNPFNNALVSSNLIKAKKEQLGELEERNRIVNKMLNVEGKYKVLEGQKLDNLKYIEPWLVDGAFTKIANWIENPQDIPLKELEKEDYNEDGTVNIAHYVKRHIEFSTKKKDGSLATVSRKVTEIDSISKEIKALEQKSADLHKSAMEDRFADKQIIGVLSQMTISTVPGFPETLACRLSLYIFNYEPFSEDFAFITTYEGKKKWTPDITQCDMFIDWYTKRFLSDTKGDKLVGLEEYSVDNRMKIAYIKYLNPVTGEETEDRIIPERIEIDGETVVTGITASFRNIIQFLPILSHKNPTCQYMGSYNNDIQINMQSTDLLKVNEISKMVEKIGAVSRNNNRVTRKNFVLIKNNFLQLCGMRDFVISSFNVDTVPDNPGMYELSLGLSEYIIGTEKTQKLKRKGIVDPKDIAKAAEWIIKKAHDYATTGGSSGSNAQYKFYYDLITNERNGWLGKNQGNAFVAVNRGVSSFALFSRNEKWDELSTKLKRRVSSMLSNKGRQSELNEMEHYTKYGEFLPVNLVHSSVQIPPNMVVDVPAKLRSYLDDYRNEFVNSIEGNPNTKLPNFFDDEVGVAAECVEDQYRDELVQIILDFEENAELHRYLSRSGDRYSEKRTKKYCYPDLELPTYAEVPDGIKFKKTFLEAGIPAKKEDRDKYTQDSDTEMDPDFFIYRGSVWGSLDKDVELNKSVYEGTKNFIDLATRNKKYVLEEAIPEDKFERILDEDNKEIEDAHRTPRSGKKLDRKDIEGVALKILKVFDGDTIQVQAPGEALTIRLHGFNSWEDPNNSYYKKKSGNKDKLGVKATAVLKSILTDKDGEFCDAYIYLGDKLQGKYKRYLGNIIIHKDGRSINVSQEMILKHSRELDLKPTAGEGNPDAELYIDAFYNAREVVLRENMKSLYNLGEAGEKKIGDGMFDYVWSTTAGSLNPVLDVFKPMAGLQRMKEKILQGWKESKFSFKNEYFVPVISSFVDINSWTKNLANIGGAPFMTANLPFKNSISTWVTNILTEKPASNLGLHRFDRYAEDHIKFIVDKIRESQKDNMLSVVRAYPTFKIYFIEEDMPEWGLLDDLYEYTAVQSIDITKSRKEAADTAVIKFLNTTGTLDTSKFGLYDANGNYVPRAPKEKVKAEFQETALEQELEEFILKAGTRIQIKMGYSSDPDLLDTVFNGMVAEVAGGDVITIVAQGYGVELLQNCGIDSKNVYSAAAYTILDSFMKRPGVVHFGRWQLWPKRQGTLRLLGRKMVWDTEWEKYIHPSWWRRIKGIDYILRYLGDAKNENINFPETSWWYNKMHGGSQKFVTTQKTIWDVFQEMTRRYPGYIATVLPFDNRATMFFGPADSYYWYTDRDFTVRRKYDMDLHLDLDEPTFKKAKELSMGKGVGEDSSVVDLSDELAIVNKHIETIYADSKYKHVIHYLDMAVETSPGLFVELPADKTLRNYFNTIMQSDLGDTEEDRRTKNILNLLANIIEHGQGGHLTLYKGEGNQIGIKSDGKLKVWKTDSGELIIGEEIDRRYSAYRFEMYRRYDPNKKLVRQFHYKDSIHHIVANNIVASERNMYNKVTVGYGREAMWKNKKLVSGPSAPEKVSCLANQFIWPERIKENVVDERNARDIISAWLYGLGNLWLGMREMYDGHLTMLGDPSIKPYDFVFVNDYFTNMHGPVEVEEVNHHFSHETGFVTTIKPDLVCYVNNIMQLGTNLVAGAYNDCLTARLMRQRATVAFWSLGIAANTYAKIAFNLSFLFDKEKTNPIAFTPLLYAGRPYLAGVEGIKQGTLIQGVRGRIEAWKKLYLVDTPEAINESVNRFRRNMFKYGA